MFWIKKWYAVTLTSDPIPTGYGVKTITYFWLVKTTNPKRAFEHGLKGAIDKMRELQKPITVTRIERVY